MITMDRLGQSLVWGIVGCLTFLVLHQAYLLLGGTFVGFVPVAGVAVLVGVVTTVASHYLQPILERRGRQE